MKEKTSAPPPPSPSPPPLMVVEKDRHPNPSVCSPVQSILYLSRLLETTPAAVPPERRRFKVWNRWSTTISLDKYNNKNWNILSLTRFQSLYLSRFQKKNLRRRYPFLLLIQLVWQSSWWFYNFSNDISTNVENDVVWYASRLIFIDRSF